MGDIRKTGRLAKGRNRKVKLAPMTRAVRAALAASTLALALGASGNVMAASCSQPQMNAGILLCEKTTLDTAPVFDLTTVPNPFADTHALLGPSGGMQSLIGDGTTPAPPAGFYFVGAGNAGWGAFGNSYVASAGDVHNVHIESTGGSVSGTGNAGINRTATSTGGEAVVFYSVAATTNYLNNAGTLTADGYTDAAGIASFGVDDVTVVNSGAITADAYLGNAYGVLGVASVGDVTIGNSGPISASSVYGNAVGLVAYSTGDGAATITNSGAVDADSYFGNAVGLAVYATGTGTAAITNTGAVDADSYFGNAIGLAGYSAGAVTIDNSGAVDANSYYYGNALGLGGYSTGAGTVDITNSGAITANAYIGNATGLLGVVSVGDVTIDNSGPINVSAYLGNAIGIEGYSTGAGTVDIGNSGTVYVYSYAGNAIGVYGYSVGGNVSIDNSSVIDAYSYNGLADGIFASGADVDVANSGAIYSNGTYWSAGIEAQGTGTVTIDNDGGYIEAYAYGLGHAYGIYATGDDVTVTNSGGVVALGYYADGIQVQATGDVSVTNDGLVVGGNSALANGIDAASSGDGAAVSVVNNGTVYGIGYYGGTGIAVTATGEGSSAGVTNTGFILAAQASYGGYGAYGIVASADGDSTVDNDGGAIYVYSGGAAGGAMALSFAGDASVTNSGAITVQSNAFGRYGAYGMVASAANGNASADNSGSVDVSTLFRGVGIDANGLNGATVDNSGDIEIDAWRAYGMRAQSGNGDVNVDNSGSIYASYSSPYGYAGRAFGIFGVSSNGDVNVDNSGAITTMVSGQSIGIFGVSSNGDVNVGNSGTIGAFTEYSAAIGVYAGAGLGTAHVDNSGTIVAYASGGVAFGVLAYGDTVEGSNSGGIYAAGLYGATGIRAGSDHGTTVTTTGGIAYAYAYFGDATGIDASSAYGDTAVVNAGAVDAESYYGDAVGISATSGAGTASIYNTAAVSAYSYYGNAAGLYAVGAGDVTIGNDGDLGAYSIGGHAYGAFAYSYAGDASVDNGGSIHAGAGGTFAAGAFAITYASDGTASVNNSGDIVATNAVGTSPGQFAYGAVAIGGYAEASNSGSIAAYGYIYGVGMLADSTYGTTVTNTGGSIFASGLGGATGILAESEQGDVLVDNASEITAEGTYFGARGISATGYGDVTVANSGDITALSDYGSVIGVHAYSYAGDVSVDNGGAVFARSYFADAIGVYGYSYAGNVAITNTDYVVAVAAYSGLADGIFASGGDVSVDNSGDVVAVGYSWAAGIEAQATGTTAVSNAGSIYALSLDATHAYGIYATGADVTVANAGDGSIEAQGYYATGIEARSYGDVVVSNEGSIIAGMPYTSVLATGINASGNSDGASVTVTNGGDVTAQGYYGGTGIAATAAGAGGTASVTNSGTVYASQYYKYGYGAYGIVSSADGDATATNDGGSIEVHSGGVANGLAALSFAGNASVTNSGDITVDNTAALYYAATGIVSAAANGDAYVGNSGSVDVSSLYWATGVEARGLGDTTVENSGSVYANGDKYAFGVYASAGTGDVNVHNGGAGEIGFYSYAGRGWGVFGHASQGDVNVSNEGVIDGYSWGETAGVFGDADQGNVNVANSGSITVTNGGSAAIGVFARADLGTASVTNSGDISTSDFPGGSFIGDVAYGIYATGAYAQVSNGGTILADGYLYATGIAAVSGYGTTVSNSGGSISAYAVGAAYGIHASSPAGDVVVNNASDIVAEGTYLGASGIEATSLSGDVGIANSASVGAVSTYGMATGLYAGNDAGNVVIANSGVVDATSPYGPAAGIVSYTHAGNATIGNSGALTVYGAVGVYGIYADSYSGDVAVTNGGSIDAYSLAHAIGVYASSYAGNVTVSNGGTVGAASDNGTSFGIYAVAGGDVTIDNGGDVIATSNSQSAIGVAMYSLGGASTLNNSGSISYQGGYGGLAVQGGDAVDTVNNSGTITGAISLFGGDDVVNNQAGGVLELTAATLDTGAGDDTINNEAGGFIRLDGGTITLGDAVGGNAFNNSGTIEAFGSSAIDLGGGGGGSGGSSLVAMAVPSLNALPLVNDGLIDFVDGATDDMLTIVGDMAGSGDLHIDLSFLNNAADQLYVDGSIASGSTQTVDIEFTELPNGTESPVVFAQVTGDSSAGNFVAGEVTGFSGANFLALGVEVVSQIDATNATNDVFSVGIATLGLNDAGSLAASISSGAAAFMNSQVGTFRQRLGVNPYGDPGKVLSAFARVYSDEGDVTQQHDSDFGNVGNFDFNQSSWGREIGINANLYGNLHAGLMLGDADSRQRLNGGGVGENRMGGMTWGAYATWYVPEGFYVDLSGRWMAANIRSTSSAGVLGSRAHVASTSIEAGYQWKLANGLTLVPQAQYTRTEVQDVRTLQGDLATFSPDGGTFSRGRLGVEANMSFDVNGVKWTPYGSISAVREFDGESTYTVADNFHGSTSVEGTSTMVELGVGVQKGGLGFTIGANWTDGGAYQSFFGGQAVIRYAW